MQRFPTFRPFAVLVAAFGMTTGMFENTGVAAQQDDLESWLRETSGSEAEIVLPSESTTRAAPTAASPRIERTNERETYDGRSNYFRLRAGVNMMPDLKLDDLGPDPVSLVGLRDAKLKVNPGLDFQLAYGRRIVGDLYFEIATQSQWNTVESIEGTVYRNNPGGGLAEESQIEGGSGYLVQWPITVGLGYTFRFTDSIELNLNGGIGVQFNFSYLENPVVPGFSGSGYSWYYQTSVTFRGQVGAHLMFALSDTVSLGVYAGASAAMNANMGDATLISRSFSSNDELKAGTFMNYAIGGSLSITF